MIPEIGHFALILCLALSIVQGVVPLIGAAKGNRALMAVARPAAIANALFGTIAFGCLAYSFYVSDFSVLNVANNSNSMLPWYYKVAATWGSHEGSILFWVVTLGWWSAAVAFSAKKLPAEMTARVTGVMGLVAMGFLTFMLFTSNPFLRLFPAPAEGADLNPLLQDPGMVFHPPLLYLGYVGFSVPFAFAIAALISGRLDAAWARWMRPWTTAAWILLTLGIALGSYWAYYELGWGGWWAWDPVENSSLMPWLTGTALMHSLAVTEKRGLFKIWTVFLAILTFSLSLLGTFLVRSGVLTSVHAFASDPQRGIFILVFLVLVIGFSFLLFAWRGSSVGQTGSYSWLSRESALLSNNVVLLVAMGSILLGTLYPLFIDALNGSKISVGAPYFDMVFGWIMIPMALFLAPGALANWKTQKSGALVREMAVPIVVSLVAGVAIPFLMGEWKWPAAAGAFLAVWILTGAVAAWWRRAAVARRQGRSTLKEALPWGGMQIAHVGVAMTIFGAVMGSCYQV